MVLLRNMAGSAREEEAAVVAPLPVEAARLLGVVVDTLMGGLCHCAPPLLVGRPRVGRPTAGAVHLIGAHKALPAARGAFVAMAGAAITGGAVVGYPLVGGGERWRHEPPSRPLPAHLSLPDTDVDTAAGPPWRPPPRATV